ncbi:MAG: hypothetical protein FWD88_01555 [Treponema sp.]|nr:hypothetical protein [Treponema sp.]
MKKKRFFMACAALAVVLLHSCRMPPAIEIRTDNFEIGIPLRAEVNIGEVLRRLIEDAFQGDNDANGILGNVRVFDMVNVAPAQAFLVAMELDMLPDFDPGYYLNYITGQMNDIGTIDMPLETSISVPSLAWDAMEPRTEYLDMTALFYTMENSLNSYSMPPMSTSLALPVPLIPGMPTVSLPVPDGNLRSFFAFRDDTAEANFEFVVLSDYDSNTNLIVLEMALQNPASLPPGLTVSLTGIQMVGETSGDPIGSPNYPQTITLNHPDFSHSVVIDLSGSTIHLDDPPRFMLGTLEIDYSGPPHGPVTLGLDISPRVYNIALRGAGGLRIGELKHPIPPEIIDNIEIDLGSLPGFLNAEIGKGTFGITVDMPQYVPDLPPGERTTFGEGVEIGINLAIDQAPEFFDGMTFDGIVGPWIFYTENPLDLDGKTINGSGIVINPDASSLLVRAGPAGISFELFGDDYTYKRLPVTVGMAMNIERLEVVRWKLDDNLIPLPGIEVDFTDVDGNGTDITEFIESIYFEKIELVLDFIELDQALEGVIALVVDIPELGFHGVPEILTKGPNTISSDLERLDFANPDNHHIAVRVDLVPVVGGVPVIGGRYLEIGPFILDGEDETVMDMSAAIDFNLAWTRAYINLGAILEDDFLSGETESFDLGNMLGGYMSGFTFADNAIGLGVYLQGPTDIIDAIGPTFRLSATFGDDEEPELLLDQRISIAEGFPELPAAGIFAGTGLPTGGLAVNLDNFLRIISDMPDSLRFTYELELGYGGVIGVTQDMFDDVAVGDIRAMVVMKIALDFVAEAGAYFSLPMFQDQADLFGRSQLGDALFGDDSLNIELLRIRLDFNDSIFRGARLHLDADRHQAGLPNQDILFGREGLSLADRHGNLDITITDRHMDLIARKLVPPDIQILYRERTNLRIPRNPLPTRITIAARGSYILTFDN